MEKLSKHFLVEEFELSETAQRKGIDNEMSDQAKQRASILCNEILERVRAHFGAPVIINSGYRCEALNKQVGGSPSSQHTLGEAADIRVVGHSPFEVAAWIVHDSGLEFDQCIYEYNSWVHVSFTKRYKNRNEALTINRNSKARGIHV